MMKKLMIFATLSTLLVVAFQNCSQGFNLGGGSSGSGEFGLSSSNFPGNKNREQGTLPIVAGKGALVSGVGAASVPTDEAVIYRIENGLNKIVTQASPNFAASLAKVKSNLPKTTDPTQATGFDQVQLLAYGACSDVTPALMNSSFGITSTGTIDANKENLIKAGMTILDRLTANLATEGGVKDQLRNTFNELVENVKKEAGSTTQMAFISVCIASLTTGSSMLGL